MARHTSADASDAGGDAEQGFRIRPEHTPPRVSGNILQVMLVVYAGTMIANAGVGFAAANLMKRLVDGEYASDTAYVADALPLRDFGKPFESAAPGMFTICVIAYLVFVCMAAGNLSDARATGFKRSAGGAFGLSLLPIANVYLVPAIMRDIWVSSHDPWHGKARPTELVLPWWLLFLASATGERMLHNQRNIAADVEDVQTVISTTWMLSLTLLAMAISCVMLAVIVRSIVRAQARWRDLPPPAAKMLQEAPA